ncbi:MAG: hypothetical protein H6Q59_1371 [Firmicutes bacterium]|nr:hypothetical protein [Bacillota bacterium]
MNFLSRKELYVTMDMMKLNSVINLLTKEHITFINKTQNTTRQNGKAATLGLNNNGMFLYYIYVHKDDFEKAKLLIKDK